MNENLTKPNAAEGSQKKGNLRLVSQFIQELLDRPGQADPIPEGASVVLLPPEDQGNSALRRANLRMAQELAAEGRIVVLWTVGSQEPAASHGLDGQRAFFRQDN